MINKNFDFEEMMSSLKEDKDDKFLVDLNSALQSLAKAAVASSDKKVKSFLIKAKKDIEVGLEKIMK
jgi:hypothetical protein